MKKKFFITNKKIKLPLDKKKYLLPFLTKTTINTKYYDTPENLKINKDYFAEKILQFHQMVDIFHSIGINLKNKNFLDIGTGNGIIPKILLLTNKVKTALGTDMYVPYEHSSAKIPHNKNIFDRFLKYFKTLSKNNKLSYNSYSKDLNNKVEKEVFKPENIIIEKLNFKKFSKYKFLKIGAQSLRKINKKFDIIYCKGFEHIHHWKLVIKNINLITNKGSLIYLKIRPFGAYLGPHRFASTYIPWGHILLNEEEYKRYVYEFHYNRAEKMLKNFYDTLSYPRYTTDDLIQIFEKYKFYLVCKKIETPPYVNKIIKFKNKIKDFNLLIKKNYNTSNAELITSVEHIIFKKF